VKTIKITNEKYLTALGAFSYDSRTVVEFVVCEPPRGRIFFYLVTIPADTTPEQWLLELATIEEVVDAQGRHVSAYVDCFSFDHYSGDSPRLYLSYYGFTWNQVKEAILKELKPDDNPMPELEEHDVLLSKGDTFPRVVAWPEGCQKFDDFDTIHRPQPDGSLKEIWRRK
jgi:hypothetical protein